MQDFILIFFNSLYALLNAMSMYILFGLLFAGVLKQFVSQDFIRKHLGQNKISTILKSAILGIPMPLCSCSVLPFASALKKDGASKSAIQTFLISTPITGVDSVLATYGACGWIFTIYRLISSIFISLIAGFLTLIFDKDKPKAMFFTQKPQDFSFVKPKATLIQEVAVGPFYQRVYNYAFKTLLKDIAKPFLIGLIIAAFISSFLPNSLPAFLENSHFLSYLAILFISLPIYVCATASIPIGISFVIAGFSPGAAFIFLTAGPASNAVTILLVKQLLGKKSLFIYLSSIFTGSIIFAYLLDAFFEKDVIKTIQGIGEIESSSGFSLLCSIVLLMLCVKVLIPKKHSSCCGSC